MKKINIEDFRGLDVKIEYKKIMDKYGKKTRNILRSTSPKSGRPNRATPYSEGWIVTPSVFEHGYRDVVWNETNWQLTHLLENGHFITNQGALSWSPPQKHIKEAYLNVKDSYIRAMRKAELEADFK